jgi:sulfatase modifying factor 1
MKTGLGAVLVALMTTAASTAVAHPSPKAPVGMTRVGAGIYRPLYPASAAEREVKVNAFYLDVKPVTNGEFAAFVAVHSEWRRDRAKRLLADAAYLAHWAAPDAPGDAVRVQSPVTNVSWFAAKAYCAAKSQRLPTEREWELAALASETAADGSGDALWLSRILAFYATPASAPLAETGAGAPNFWGVYDMHGLIWEWIYDFGASLVVSDSREKGDAERNRFCGTAGADARDPRDYAAFMRSAFRSSLEASYTTSRLGFRCAADIKESP